MNEFLRACIDALGSGSLEIHPFSAPDRKRKQPRLICPIWVTHIKILYRRWNGPKLPFSEDFGKGRGQVYPLDGGPPERSCNEVEVAKLLLGLRDKAYWLCCYQANLVPSLWKPWVLSPETMPQWLQELDGAIRKRIAARSGGIPDVVAWNEAEPKASAVFVECKGKNEPFKESQEDWVSAAVCEGVSSSQFAVAIRTFVDE